MLKPLLVMAAAGLATAFSPAMAASADHCDSRSEACVHSDRDGFTGGGTKTAPGRAGQQGHAGGAQPVSAPLSPTYTETSYVPTCSANGPTRNGDLCSAATDTCPNPDELRFWVYTREVTRATGAVTDWTLVTAPAYVCLAPEDPVINPAAAIPAIVERDFQKVVVLKGIAEVSPRPDTLVNIATVFTTSSPESYDIPLALLGQSVVITATAQRWTWHVGDGTEVTSAKGTKGRVEHEYRTAGARQAYLVIEWSGTFRINGGAAQPIAGRATTTGNPVDVGVKQARTQLVAD